MNLGGTVNTLEIVSVNSEGNAVAKVGGVAYMGMWDEDSQKLMLSARGQLLVGYLFTDTVNLTAVNGTVFFTLAGTAESYQPGFEFAPKHSTVGWYAQIGVG